MNPLSRLRRGELRPWLVALAILACSLRLGATIAHDLGALFASLGGGPEWAAICRAGGGESDRQKTPDLDSLADCVLCAAAQAQGVSLPPAPYLPDADGKDLGTFRPIKNALLHERADGIPPARGPPRA